MIKSVSHSVSKHERAYSYLSAVNIVEQNVFVSGGAMQGRVGLADDEDSSGACSTFSIAPNLPSLLPRETAIYIRVVGLQIFSIPYFWRQLIRGEEN